MRRAWTYAAVGYGEYRRIPWDPTTPIRWAADLDPVAGMVTVGYGNALIGAVLLAACAFGPRRLLRPDVPRWLVAFLAIVLSCLAWSHAVRFSATQAAELFPLALVSGVVATGRLPRVRGCLLAVAFAGALGWTVYTTASILQPPDGERTDLPQLALIPLRPAEEVSLRALRNWWAADDHPSDRVFVVNLRNDLTAANEVIVYWWLDARPAAWATTFDPGLADQAEVHDDVIDDLCEHRLPPVVRHTAVYGNAELDGRLHFSRRLDEFIAMNYELAARAALRHA